MNILTFDNSTKKFILECFGKTLDSEGYLVEKNKPSQRVLTPDGEEIEERQFAGVRKGSEIYIKSDLISLIRLCDALE